MAVNAKVVARRNSDGSLENIESLLRRFKKEYLYSCTAEECEKRKFYRTKKELKKFKHDMLMRHTKNKKYKFLNSAANKTDK